MSGFTGRTPEDTVTLVGLGSKLKVGPLLDAEKLTSVLKKVARLEKEMETGKEGIFKYMEKHIRPVFESLDNRGKEYIMFSEFARFIHILKADIPEEKIAFLYFVYDRNNDTQ